MPRDDTSKFLKKFDRYGQPVCLTYKNNGAYNTAAGGVFTVLTTLIFMTFFAMEVYDVYLPPGKHNVSSVNTVTQLHNSSWPIENLTMQNFFVAYRV